MSARVAASGPRDACALTQAAEEGERTRLGLLVGSERVEVYWNRNRQCWSVRSATTRRLLRHAKEIVLEDCSMHVSARGRERVIREGRRNVHAWIRGTLAAPGPVPGGIRIRYNPWEMASFVRAQTGEAVARAGKVSFLSTGEVLAGLST